MRDFGWVCCHSGSFPEAGLNWCQKTESCNCVAPVTLDGPSRFGRGHEDSSESPSASREVLPERMNQAIGSDCHELVQQIEIFKRVEVRLIA
jgi:hypothetical protein